MCKSDNASQSSFPRRWIMRGTVQYSSMLQSKYASRLPSSTLCGFCAADAYIHVPNPIRRLQVRMLFSFFFYINLSWYDKHKKLIKVNFNKLPHWS